MPDEMSKADLLAERDRLLAENEMYRKMVGEHQLALSKALQENKALGRMLDDLEKKHRELEKIHGDQTGTIEKELDTGYKLEEEVYPQTEDALTEANGAIMLASGSPYVAKTKEQLKELEKAKSTFETAKKQAISELKKTIDDNEDYIKYINDQLRRKIITEKYAKKFTKEVNKCQKLLKDKLEELEKTKFDIIENIKRKGLWKMLAKIIAGILTIVAITGAIYHLSQLDHKNQEKIETDNQIKQEEVVETKEETKTEENKEETKTEEKKEDYGIEEDYTWNWVWADELISKMVEYCDHIQVEKPKDLADLQNRLHEYEELVQKGTHFEGNKLFVDDAKLIPLAKNLYEEAKDCLNDPIFFKLVKSSRLYFRITKTGQVIVKYNREVQNNNENIFTTPSQR